jgi:hypothetical protein
MSDRFQRDKLRSINVGAGRRRGTGLPAFGILMCLSHANNIPDIQSEQEFASEV